MRLLAGAGLALGCVPFDAQLSPEGDRTSGVPDTAAAIPEIEPNDGFATPNAVDAAGGAGLSGIIDAAGDRDVFLLGRGQAGERWTGTFSSPQPGELMFCLFDANQRILARAAVTSGTQAAQFQVNLPESTDALYLVASIPPGGAVHPYSGSFAVNVSAGPADPRPQLVLLDFDGAERVAIAGHRYDLIPAFDAGVINAAFSGRTAELVQGILDHVRGDYAGLGVQFELASTPGLPIDSGTVIYFGTESPDLLGEADDVDAYNAEAVQAGIIYTDTFRLFNGFEPTLEDEARLLANVTSHEIGHLLGLRHTADADDIMDVTASARRLMIGQWFKLAPLYTGVCAIGFQDGPALLSWTVGGQLVAPARAAPGRSQVIARGTDFRVARRSLCGHCRE
jgi:hypothetical protein